MKRIFLLSLLMCICATGIWVTRGERPLPKGADVSPEIALRRAVELASFGRPIDPQRPDARLAEWQRALRRQLATLLPEFPEVENLKQAARRLAEEIAGVSLSEERVIEASPQLFFVLNEDGSRELVIKAFTNIQHRRSQLMPQLSALNVWRHLELRESTPMLALGLARCQIDRSPCAVLAFRASPGLSIESHLHAVAHCEPGSPARLAALSRANDAVAAVGRALAELHLQQRGRYTQLRSSDSLIKDTRRLVDQDGSPELRAQAEECISAAKAAPVALSYAHGMMSLRNAVYDDATRQLTFIDTASLPRSFDRHERPCGFGIMDYCRFSQELRSLDPALLSGDEIHALTQRFSESYLSVCPQSEALLELAGLRAQLRAKAGQAKA